MAKNTDQASGRNEDGCTCQMEANGARGKPGERRKMKTNDENCRMPTLPESEPGKRQGCSS